MEKVSSNLSNNNLGSEESGVSQLGTPNATRICKYYAKNGVCKRYRSVCPFAHVDPKQKLDLENFILKEGKWEFESSGSSDEEIEKSLQTKGQHCVSPSFSDVD